MENYTFTIILPSLPAEEKTTRTLTKTYPMFCLYSFLVMQKIVNSHCDRISRLLRIKVERTRNHRVLICISKTHANKPHFVLPCFLENYVVHQKSKKQNPIIVIEGKHKLLRGGNGNRRQFPAPFHGR